MVFQCKWRLPREAAVFVLFCFVFLHEAAVAIAMQIVRYSMATLLPFAKMLLSLNLNICLTYQPLL